MKPEYAAHVAMYDQIIMALVEAAEGKHGEGYKAGLTATDCCRITGGRWGQEHVAFSILRGMERVGYVKVIGHPSGHRFRATHRLLTRARWVDSRLPPLVVVPSD